MSRRASAPAVLSSIHDSASEKDNNHEQSRARSRLISDHSTNKTAYSIPTMIGVVPATPDSKAHIPEV